MISRTEAAGDERRAMLAPAALHRRANALGGTIDGAGLVIPFFDRAFRVSADGVEALEGPPPSPTLGNIFLDYVRRRPPAVRNDPAWITFRELPGAGPLVIAFANNTHKTIARTFGGEPGRLREACESLNGRFDAAQPGFDLVAEFDALPRVPVSLRFNTADDPFPAEAALLFRSHVSDDLGLDALFAVATYLTGRLIQYQ